MSSKPVRIKEDKIAEIKEILKSFMLCDSGKYNAAETGTILRILGHNPSTEIIKKFAFLIDPSQSGAFDLDTFLDALKSFDFKDPAESNVESAIALLDQELKGTLEVSLLKDILLEYEEKLTSDEFDIVIKALDPNKTGKIKAEDIIKLMH